MLLEGNIQRRSPTFTNLTHFPVCLDAMLPVRGNATDEP